MNNDEVMKLRVALQFYARKENYTKEKYWAFADGSTPSRFDHDPEGLIEYTGESKVQEDAGAVARKALGFS